MMYKEYKNFFGFMKEPFPQDIEESDICILPGLGSVLDRFFYALDIASVMVITGDVGTGKSTSLRFASAQLHPSKYRVVSTIANTGTVLELLRQTTVALDTESRSHSITVLTKIVRNAVMEIVGRKQIPVLAIDEAHLLRLEVLSQIHTIFQFEFDSKPVLPIVLSGQNTLIDKLMYHTSRPFASRVAGRSHLEGLKLKDMIGYLNHHLQIAGVNEQLFSEEAINALQQGSGGLLRRVNLLAKGALIAAAIEKCKIVSAEHVRIASTEVI